MLLRRAILLLAVAAVMAAMMAVSAMPATAKVFSPTPPGQNGGGPPQITGGPSKNGSSTVDHGPEGSCVTHYGKNLSKPPTGGGC